MKNLLTLFLGLAFTSLLAQTPGVVDNKIHKVVIQFSSGDSTQQAGMMTQLGNLRTALPQAEIEVVCHSSGLDMLTIKKSKVSSKVAEYTAQGITFAACSNSMRLRNVKKEDLLPSPIVVPSAMVELIQKQEKGWSYLKGGH